MNRVAFELPDPRAVTPRSASTAGRSGRQWGPVILIEPVMIGAEVGSPKLLASHGVVSPSPTMIPSGLLLTSNTALVVQPYESVTGPPKTAMFPLTEPHVALPVNVRPCPLSHENVPLTTSPLITTSKEKVAVLVLPDKSW